MASSVAVDSGGIAANEADENTSALADLLELRPWDRFRGGHVAFVAVRDGGIARNILASLVFEPANRDPRNPTTIEVAEFVIGERFLGCEQVKAVLRCLGRGGDPTLDLGDLSLALFGGKEGYVWRDHGESYGRAAHGWHGRCFQGTGPSVGQFVDAAELYRREKELRSATPVSFPSWDAVGRVVSPQRQFLSRNFSAINAHQQAAFEIHLPTYVRFSTAQFDPNRGVVTIGLDAPDRQRRILVVLRDHAGMEVARIVEDEFEESSDDRDRLVVSLPSHRVLAEGSIDCELIVDGRFVESWTAGVPPTLARLHAALDRDGAWLAKLLGTKKGTRADQFEAGIVALLGSAGVATIHYGRHNQSDEMPDIVGQIDEATFLAAEVTVALPDFTKLAELRNRSEAIRRTLSAFVPTARVSTAIFFQVDYADVPLDILRVAQSQAIALVSADRIDALYQGVLGGTVIAPTLPALLASWVP